jgi:D-amino-acid oxidase
LARTTGLSAELQAEKPELLAVFAGLRPSRHGGARVERGHVEVDGEKKVIVHNYGAGGTGFQAGYGMALTAVEAADDVLRTLKTVPKAKL